MGLCNRLMAEIIGTAWLVIGGVGAAVFAAAYPELGIGFLGVALAFGLAVMTAAAAVGHISGGHFNPAVTIGLFAGGRICAKQVVPYIVAQFIGAMLGAGAIYLIATGKAGFDVTDGFASNGYGDHSPGKYTMQAAFMAEALLTFFFVFVILAVTRDGAPIGWSPLIIGLCLTLTNLVAIPVTNASINPMRSTAPALFQGGWAVDQLWLFWAAPIVGAIAAGLVSRCMHGPCCAKASESCH